MRKIITLSTVVAASLLVVACGSSQPVEADNSTVTEMNAAEAMEGTTNDAMTSVDGAMGADANMAADTNATAPAEDAMAANATEAMPAENAAK